MTVGTSTTKRRTARKQTSQTTTEVNPSENQEDMVKVEDHTENGQPQEDTSQEKKLEVVTKAAKEETPANTASTQIQVAPKGMIMRPIEHSNLEIAGMLSANRPIFKASSATALTLIPSEEMAGVMANRPVEASHLQISGMVMNRPVATNEIDDPITLMGFLD